MGNVILGQYDSTQYPLVHFLIGDIPFEIINTMQALNEQDLAVYRGGLGFIFLLGQENYILKDLDMMALNVDKNRIVNRLIDADAIYINKNSFGQPVITAFWEAKDGYYKLDVLLVDKLPDTTVCKFNGIYIKSVTASYIWRNRISKIAEKKQRKHTFQKTNNHYHVAKILSEYLIKNPDKIVQEDVSEVIKKIPDMKKELNSVIGIEKVSEFMHLLEQITGK